MDRQHRRSLQHCGCLGSPPRVQVLGPQIRPPAPDGQQREIERPERLHVVEQIRVTGEVDTAATPFDHEAERRPMRSRQGSPTAVVRVHDENSGVTDGHDIAGRHLDDLAAISSD